MQTGTVVTTECARADAQLNTGEAHTVTAGTAVVLGSTTNVREVLIQAKFGNTGMVYIGPANVKNDGSNGIYLATGDSLKLYCTSLAEIYVNSTVNGEGVEYLCW
jgi:hypothetical protein